MAILAKAWALVAPWAGKRLLRLLPWLLPAWTWLKALVPVVISGVILAAVIWGWWALRDAEPTVKVSEVKQVCEDANLRARIAALEDALRVANQTLQQRREALEWAEEEIRHLHEEMEALRAAAPDPDALVFDADDPWLRAGSRNQVRRTAGR